MLTKTKTYYIWLEHCSGGSSSHQCSKGSWSDPEDLFEPEIKASPQDEAEKIGWEMLQKFVNEFEHCTCSSYTSPVGCESWWKSISLVSSLEPYPNYVNDEAK